MNIFFFVFLQGICLNCCVYNRTVNKTLFLGKILSLDEPETSVEQYFERKIVQEI